MHFRAAKERNDRDTSVPRCATQGWGSCQTELLLQRSVQDQHMAPGETITTQHNIIVCTFFDCIKQKKCYVSLTFRCSISSKYWRQFGSSWNIGTVTSLLTASSFTTSPSPSWSAVSRRLSALPSPSLPSLKARCGSFMLMCSTLTSSASLWTPPTGPTCSS